MRDLSKSFSKTQRARPPRLIRVLILVVVVFGALFLAKTFLGGGALQVSDSALILKDAPSGLKPVAVSDTTAASGGVNLTTQTINLKDVKYDGDASGTAARSYGGGIYRLEVNVNVPDPKNVALQVWLVGAGAPRPIDVMRGSKNSWSFSFSDTDKYSSYSGIWVTLERNKADSIVEEHVLEGQF
ncbi:MAG: hypothetical protein WD988_01145 [Candidatus Curtissbacteria bacterium]